jgi:hypothetical protein
MSQFKPEWFEQTRKEIKHVISDTESAPEAFERCRRYIDRIEGAIAGNNGHKTTFRVACKIRDFLAEYISPEQAMPIMREYNNRCEPEWSEAGLV